MSDKPTLSRAQEFAHAAHEGLFSMTISGAKRPQIVHLQEVADLVWASGGSDEEIAAAWLHDVVEDTPVTLEDIENEFGAKIAALVRDLTDDKQYESLPIRERKALQIERIRNANESVRRVKIADQTSNVRFVAIDPPECFSGEQCNDYVHAAKRVIDVCRGISPLLDRLFDEAHATAVKQYGEDRGSL